MCAAHDHMMVVRQEELPIQTYIYMQDLERTAHAATSQLEIITAGNTLVQAEVDFLKKRLKFHMDAALSSKQDIPATAVSEGDKKLHAALRAAKTAQDRLVQTNKVLLGGQRGTEQAMYCLNDVLVVRK